MFGCKPCSVKDETSTVKVDMSKFDQPSGPSPEALAAQEEEKRKAAEAEKKRREEEDARKRRAEEEARKEKERKDAEEKQQREKEQAAAEAQRLEAEEQARKLKEEQEAERVRQEQEREQAAARERELEAEKQRAAQQKALEEDDLREQLTAWLKKNGLADANAKKKSMMPPSHCFPLHVAVKQKDAQMVRALLLCGANKTTPNSSGQTALDLANKNNKGGVLDDVIAALG